MTDHGDDNEKMTARITAAREAGAQEFYSNGNSTAIGSSDVVIVFERNGEAALILNLSYTSTKSLAASLTQLIAEIEERAGRDIMTSEEINRLFSDARESKDDTVLGSKRRRIPNSKKAN